MNKKIIANFFLGCFLIFNSCNHKESSSNTSIKKIMILGASRVEGNRPVFESFRYETWKNLVSNNQTFDFIGTQKDPAEYPPYNELEFDADHQGFGGWTSEQILNHLQEWIEITGAPDIVLFSSPAGNDGLQNLSYDQAIENINGIIDILQSNNPNITIVVEQAAPGRTDVMTPKLLGFYYQMQADIQTIASEQTTEASKIIPIDMYTGFNDSMLADGVHYNQLGARFIAERYYDVLAELLRN